MEDQKITGVPGSPSATTTLDGKQLPRTASPTRDCATPSSIPLRSARPPGRRLPDELAEVCKKLDTRLTAEQAKLASIRHPIFATPTWKATTVVGKAIARLSAYSGLTVIRVLAQLSDDEQRRKEQLREDLARDPAAGAKQVRLRATRIQALANDLNAIETRLTDASLAAVGTAQTEAAVARKAATVAAATLFSGHSLPGIGEPVWRCLWDSARRYSEAQAYPGRPFPGGRHSQAWHCPDRVPASRLSRPKRSPSRARAQRAHAR